MATRHAMWPIAEPLRDAGLAIWELGPEFDHSGHNLDWTENEQGYFWTDQHGDHARYAGLPLGHLHHHTASSGYTPYVKNSSGQTKANGWLGLRRGNRLYETGGGVPTLALASAGPADYSAGKGWRGLLTDYVARDRQFNGPARAVAGTEDDAGFYGNRHYWSTEIIHRGGGQPLDPAVWDFLIVYDSVLNDTLGWTPWRNVAHEDHTRRKVDVRFAQGAPYTMRAIQAELVGGEIPTIPPPPNDDLGGIHPMWPLNYGDGTAAGRPEKRDDVKYLQNQLGVAGANLLRPDLEWKVDGIYGDTTTHVVYAWWNEKEPNAVNGRFVNGYMGSVLDSDVAIALGGGTPPPPAAHDHDDRYPTKSHKHGLTATTGPAK